MDEFELVKAMILTMVKIHLWGVEVEHLDRAGFSFKIPRSTLNNKDKVKFIHDQLVIEAALIGAAFLFCYKDPKIIYKNALLI